MVDSDSASQQLVEECEPGEGYTYCISAEQGTLTTWQEDVAAGDPEWRTIEPVESEKIEHRVRIDVSQLNGGFIPTADGQGHYESEEHLQQTIAELLGLGEIPGPVALSIGGTSAKVTPEGEISPATTGNFVFDAISTADGKVYINGQDATEDVYPEDVDELDIFASEESSSSELEATASSELRTTSYASVGNWEAKHVTMKTSPFITYKVGGVTKGIKWAGKRCRFTWNPLDLFYECYKAGINISNSYRTYNGGLWGFDDVDSGYGTRLGLFIHGFFWEDIPHGVCSSTDVSFPGGQVARTGACVNTDG